LTLTSLEGLDLLKCLALGLLSLLQLRHLDLLAELLQVPQLASLSRRLLVGGLLYELCLDLLSEVVLRTGEGDAFFDELSAADAYGLEGLRVEGELALQVVGNIGDGVGGWGGGEDGLVEGEGSGWEGDARKRGEEGGGIVDGEASVRDQILLVSLVEIFEVGNRDVLLVLVFLFLFVFVVICVGNLCAVDYAGLFW
jgi:hypothetical protein